MSKATISYLDKHYIVTIISQGKKVMFNSKEKANKYAREVMTKQGLSVSVKEYSND